MEPVNSNRKSVLNSVSPNVQLHSPNDQCEIGILRNLPSSKNTSLSSARSVSKMDRTCYSDDSQSDEENQPPINNGDFQFKEPYLKKMPKDDSKLNAIIDNLNFLKIGESPRPENRFNLFKWTTPLKGNKINTDKNRKSDPDLSASETDEEFSEAMESLQEPNSKPVTDNYSRTSTMNQKFEKIFDKKDKIESNERVPELVNKVSEMLNEELDEFVDAETNETEDIVTKLMEDSMMENDFHLSISNDVSVVDNQENNETFTVKSDLTFEVEIKDQQVVQILEENNEGSVQKINSKIDPIVILNPISTSVLETFEDESDYIPSPEEPCLDTENYDKSHNCETNSDEAKVGNEVDDESIAIKITATHSEDMETAKTAENVSEEFINVIRTSEDEIITTAAHTLNHCEVKNEINETKNIELSLEEISDTSLEMSCNYDLNSSQNQIDMSLTEIFAECKINNESIVVQRNKSISIGLDDTEEFSNEKERSQIDVNVPNTSLGFETKSHFDTKISNTDEICSKFDGKVDLNSTSALGEKNQINSSLSGTALVSGSVIKNECEEDTKNVENLQLEKHQIDMNSTYSFPVMESEFDNSENEKELIFKKTNELFDSNLEPDIDISKNLESENSQINLNLTSIASEPQSVTVNTPVIQEDESITYQKNEIFLDSTRKLDMDVTRILGSEKCRINSTSIHISSESESVTENGSAIPENDSISIQTNEIFLDSTNRPDMDVTQILESEKSRINFTSTNISPEPEPVMEKAPVIQEDGSNTYQTNEIFLDSIDEPDMDVTEILESKKSQINFTSTHISPEPEPVMEKAHVIQEDGSNTYQTNEIFLDSTHKPDMDVTQILESEKSRINFTSTNISPEPEPVMESAPFIQEDGSNTYQTNEIFLDSTDEPGMDVTEILESEKSRIHFTSTHILPEPESVMEKAPVIQEDGSNTYLTNEIFLDSTHEPDMDVTKNLEFESSEINLNFTSISSEPQSVTENVSAIPKNESTSIQTNEIFLDSTNEPDMDVTQIIESEKSRINFTSTNISPEPKPDIGKAPVIQEDGSNTYQTNEIFLDSTQKPDMDVTQILESERCRINSTSTNISSESEPVTEDGPAIPESESISNPINEIFLDSTPESDMDVTQNLEFESSEINFNLTSIVAEPQSVTENASTFLKNESISIQANKIFLDSTNEPDMNVTQILESKNRLNFTPTHISPQPEPVIKKAPVISENESISNTTNEIFLDSSHEPEMDVIQNFESEKSRINFTSTNISSEPEPEAANGPVISEHVSISNTTTEKSLDSTDQLDMNVTKNFESGKSTINFNYTGVSSEPKLVTENEPAILNNQSISNQTNEIFPDSVQKPDTNTSQRLESEKNQSNLNLTLISPEPEPVTDNESIMLENHISVLSKANDECYQSAWQPWLNITQNLGPEKNEININSTYTSPGADSTKESDTVNYSSHEKMVDENQPLVPEDNSVTASQDEEMQGEEMDIDNDTKDEETNKITECSSELNNEDDNMIDEDALKVLSMEACQQFLSTNRYSLPVIFDYEIKNALNSSGNEQETEECSIYRASQTENRKSDSEPVQEIPDRKSIRMEDNVETQLVNVTYDLSQEKVKDSVSNEAEQVNREIQQKSNVDEFQTPERNNFDDSMFCKPMPVSKKIETPSSSPCLLIFESCFNADYCAGNTPKSSRNSSFRSALKDKRVSEMSQTGPALLDMSIGCFEQYTANVASNIPNTITGDSDFNRTVDVDDTVSFSPKPEELLIIPDYPCTRNVKTQTHDSELDELRNENKYLRDLAADLMEKFNGLREAALALRHNEAILKAAVAEHEDNNRKLSNRYELLKDYSNTLLAESNQKLDEMEKINSVLKARLKDHELK